MSNNVMLRVERAATLLDATPNAIRKRINRACRVDADGVQRADLDAGISAVKIHGSWRLLIPEQFARPSNT